MKKIRVGTRDSKLAIAQTEIVIKEISKIFPDIGFEIISMKTKGDIILDRRLDKIGGKGLFIKELEVGLLENKIDMAVHSYKDMPGKITDGLLISAVLKREDPGDIIITKNNCSIEDLPQGAVLGTSSRRREVQILALRPDLKIKNLRGNVLTRLDKLVNEDYDAIILAKAGVKRLGIWGENFKSLETENFIPAVAQGILAVQTRAKDAELISLLKAINCDETECQSIAERGFLSYLDGGCSIPMGAIATISEEQLELKGFVADDSNIIYRSIVKGNKKDAKDIGEELAKNILFSMKRNGGRNV